MKYHNFLLLPKRCLSSTTPKWNTHQHSNCESRVRVRFAPSPTGQLHLGGLRTAFYNYVFARKHGGDFILRIEDTDRERLVPGSVQTIEDVLRWAHLEPDEGPSKGGDFGPYYQSERLRIYASYVEQLLNAKKAYKCFCSSTRLDLLRKFQSRNREKPRYDGKCRNLSEEEIAEKLKETQGSYVVRFHLKPGVVTFDDMIYGQLINTFVDGMETDPVIMKSDGYPTYHLANVVDDHLMKISHVLRGSEWISSTAKHVRLYEAFDWSQPKFMHFPLITMRDGSKMSKRNDDTQISALRKSGYRPLAILNFLTSMGGGVPKDKQDSLELWNLDRIVSEFNFGSINCNGSSVDIDKFRIYNSKALQKSFSEDPRAVLNELKQILKDEGIQTDLDDTFLTKLLAKFIGRIVTLRDLISQDNAFLWHMPVLTWNLQEYQEGGWDLNKLVDELIVYAKETNSLEDKKVLVDKMNSLAASQGKDRASVMRLIRKLLTNSDRGLSIYEIFNYLGKDKLIDYLNNCRKYIN